MVEDDDVGRLDINQSVDKILDRFTTHVSAVVTPYDNDATINDSSLINQQMDTSLLDELLGLRLACIKLMITQTGIHWCFQPMELLGHVLFNQWAHAAIDNITSNQDEVGLLGINHIHPSRQFLAGIMITYMKIRSHHHLICFC